MSVAERKLIRHFVSIAGCVRLTTPTGAATTSAPLRRIRIAGAHVEIVLAGAPQAFQTLVKAEYEARFRSQFGLDLDGFVADLHAGQLPEALGEQFRRRGRALGGDARAVMQQPGNRWTIVDARTNYFLHKTGQRLLVFFNPRHDASAGRGRRRRVDCAQTVSDGVFYFTDLPAGDYRLQVSMPRMGSRYGVVETEPIQVHANPVGTPVKVAWTEIDLPPTEVQGKITVIDTGEPIVGAQVGLLGDSVLVRTDEEGQYQLVGVQAGRPLVKATADKFKSASRRVTLKPGQTRTANLKLESI